MNTPTPTPESAGPAAAGLLGSVRQTLADLAAIAKQLSEDGQLPPSAAAKLDRLGRELAEAAAAVRAVPGQPPEPARRPGPVLGLPAVAALLTAVAGALDIPPPAGPDDEMVFLRLRSARAAEALRAIMNVLSHQPASDLDVAWCAAWLDQALAGYPAAGYEHSPMTS
jgi:hypothetical protein